MKKINKPLIKSCTDSLVCLEVHQRVKGKKKVNAKIRWGYEKSTEYWVSNFKNSLELLKMQKWKKKGKWLLVVSNCRTTRNLSIHITSWLISYRCHWGWGKGVCDSPKVTVADSVGPQASPVFFAPSHIVSSPHLVMKNKQSFHLFSPS